jgi:hypothetical protein
MNNGLMKGGALPTYQLLHQAPGLEDVWQLHMSAKAADSNFLPEYIANVDESTAHWIKLVAGKDGAFRVFNRIVHEQDIDRATNVGFWDASDGTSIRSRSTL